MANESKGIRDIDKVILAVARSLPDVKCEQLITSHPADDNGAWFFDLTGPLRTVQVESPNGMCPFLVEDHGSDARQSCTTVDETVVAIVTCLKGRE